MKNGRRQTYPAARNRASKFGLGNLAFLLTAQLQLVQALVQAALRQELGRLAGQDLAHVSVAVREVVRASASARPVARVR